MRTHPPIRRSGVVVEICGFAHQRFARAADERNLLAVWLDDVRIKTLRLGMPRNWSADRMTRSEHASLGAAAKTATGIQVCVKCPTWRWSLPHPSKEAPTESRARSPLGAIRAQADAGLLPYIQRDSLALLQTCNMKRRGPRNSNARKNRCVNP